MQNGEHLQNWMYINCQQHISSFPYGAINSAELVDEGLEHFYMMDLVYGIPLKIYRDDGLFSRTGLLKEK